MANSFEGANLTFNNRGIHFILAEIMTFRKQLTKRIQQEFQSQSGWDNALNSWMVECLEKIADSLENITYHPTSQSKDELEAQAADTTRTLLEDYNGTAIAADNTVMPVAPPKVVVWKLDGTDADIPQVTPANCPNDFARLFIIGLDEVFTQLTRLDSRFAPFIITKSESVMIRSLLEALITITQRKGGEAARMDIPSGTLNVHEPTTFKGA